MRRELSDFVKIKVIKKLNGTEDDTVEFTVAASNSVAFEESPKKSTAGILYQQSLLLIITKEEAGKIPTLPTSLRAIVELSDGDASYVWGNAEIPVNITITPRLERVQFDMTCNSLHPLFRA